MREEAAGPLVLVVDDEPSIVDTVATAFRYAGFNTVEATTGRQAVEVARTEELQLIILDVMLPDFDGLEVARRLRQNGIQTPILFLTARDAIRDKVDGLEVGGDDYVTKPFSLSEIVARARAILRRTNGGEGEESKLRFADVELNADTFEVARAGTPIKLTATEFKLLRFFLLHPERVVSKSQILQHVWHYDFDGDAKVVETYVSYLRRKLDPLGVPLIHTIRLVGYVLREPKQHMSAPPR